MCDDLPGVIVDGAVLTDEGRIARVGPYAELRDSEAVLVEHEGRVLLPGLVNCHAHLELSYLAGLGQEDGPAGDMAAWIRNLLAEREKRVDPEEVQMAAWRALAQLYAAGCRAVLDIGNLPESGDIGANFKVAIRFHQEVLGLTVAATTAGRELLKTIGSEYALTAHAPYSTSAELMQLLKQRATKLNQLFPVHLAESAAESQLLLDGGGPLREFLEERGVWDGSFTPPGKSPVAYLADLGLLDDQTLAVHCVQVDENDIALLAESGATVCLCPGSNRFLGVGCAPVPALAAAGIRLVLGTDSLAGNPRLDLWEEMRLLRRDHPGLEPLAVLRMATGNGAELLGLADELGSLVPGCSSSFLAAELAVGAETNDETVLAALVDSGRPAKLEWVE